MVITLCFECQSSADERDEEGGKNFALSGLDIIDMTVNLAIA